MSSTIARAQREEDTAHLAINLMPLLVPYKKHGRLSLRIERLPPKARFSRGSRNNDGSWSLATDELDDLTYQLPEGFDREHAIGVRIINLVGGNTLAVLDFPVSPDGAAARTEPDTAPQSDGKTDALVHALREQLAQMKATLTARDAELAQARQTAEKAQPSLPARDIDAELSAARAEWQAELEERLAAVGAQSAAELRRHSDSWISEHNTRVAALTAQTQQQLAAAQEKWQRKAQDALAKAEEAWREGETARLAAAEAQWRAASDTALAYAHAEASKAGDAGHQNELKALHEALQSEAQAGLERAKLAWQADEAARLAAARDEWRAQTDEALERAKADALGAQDTNREHELDALRDAMQREARAALAKAEQEWKVAEAARLSAAQAQWHEAHDKALAETRAEAATTQDETQVNRALRDDIANLQAKLVASENALTEARKQNEGLRQQTQSEIEAAVAKAQTAWKAGETARLNEAKERWRAASDEALAKARTEAGAGSPADGAHDLEELRERLTALETLLADREAALAEAREIIEQQERGAHPKSQRNRKSDDAEWRAEAEAELRASYGNALAEATSRYEAAESALAQVRIKTKDGGRAHQELASTRAALAAREKELAELRAKIAPLDGQEPDGDASDASAIVAEPATQKPAPFSRAFIAGVIAAACVLAGVIVFYPSIEALVFGAPPPPPQATPAPKEAARIEPVAAPENKAVLLHDAKLRQEPATAAKTVASVTKGSEVAVVEERGKWALVRFEGSQSLQGWVLQSVLKDEPAGDAPSKPIKNN